MSSPSIDPIAAATANQILTFMIGEATYGIDITCVREIRGWSTVTRLPQAPAEVLGVLNLRGAIVPVLDLRLKFGSIDEQYTPVTVVIVVSVLSAKGPRDFGIVVDGVSDVIDIAAQDIRPAPDLGARTGSACVRGLVSISARMVVLLDVDRLISKDFSAAVSNDGTRAA